MLGHVTAGGTVELLRFLSVSAAAVALATGASCVGTRWSLSRIALASLLAQPVLHVAFGHSEQHQVTGHMTGHDMVMTVASPGGGSASGSMVSMIIAHVMVALIAALVVRWGGRWLWMLPLVARSLCLRQRGAVAPFPSATSLAPAELEAGRVPIGVLLAWDSRGPPRRLSELIA